MLRPLVATLLLLAVAHAVAAVPPPLVPALVIPAVLSNKSTSHPGLTSGEVHTWVLPASVNQCRGPLVVEFWEDSQSSAEASPLVAGALLCPVVASEMLERLESTRSKSSVAWRQFRQEPWQQPSGSGGLWWDELACARQLPYHWIVLGRQQLLKAPGGIRYVHIVNQRMSGIPEYRVRFSCEAPPALRCPEPSLQAGPCSGRGACVPAQQGTKEVAPAGVCKCPPFWLGIGCEVPADPMVPDALTTHFQKYRPEARLVWSAATNSGWVLAQLTVPPGSTGVHIELEVDWSRVPYPVMADIATTFPRLCVANAADEAAFAQGRLNISAMVCDPQPLRYPLEFRTFLDLPVATHGNATATLNVLVLGAGFYPVYLRASVRNETVDATCPFGCSNQLALCSQSTCRCDRPGTGVRGRVCQYFYNDLSAFNTFAGGRTIESEEMTVGPGQARWWVVDPMPPPLVDPSELSVSYRTRRSLVVGLVPGAGQRQAMKSLAVAGFRMQDIPADAYGAVTMVARPVAQCWMQGTYRSPFRISPACSFDDTPYRLAVQVRNNGGAPLRLRVTIGRYRPEPPRGIRWGGILNYVPAAVSITLAIFSAYLWNKRRQLVSQRARRSRRSVTAGDAAGAPSTGGVPSNIISTFPTKPYTPPSAKGGAAPTGGKPTAAAQSAVGSAAVPSASHTVACPQVVQVVVVGDSGTAGQATGAHGTSIELSAAAVGPPLAGGVAGVAAEAPLALSEQEATAAVAVSGATATASSSSSPLPGPTTPAAQVSKDSGALDTPAAAADTGTPSPAEAKPELEGSAASGSAHEGATSTASVPATCAPAGSAPAGSAPTGRGSEHSMPVSGTQAASASTVQPREEVAGAAGQAATSGRPSLDATSGQAATGGRPSMEGAIGQALRRVQRALSSSWTPAMPDSTLEDADDDSCPICLVDYEAGDLLRWLPCNHAFHQPCIDTWMASHHTCPVCRFDLLPPTPEDTAAPPAASSAPTAASTAADPPAGAATAGATALALPAPEQAPPLGVQAATIATITSSPSAIPAISSIPPLPAITSTPAAVAATPTTRAAPSAAVQSPP